MVARCKHDAAILAGVRGPYTSSRSFVRVKLPRANRYLILTFFHPPVTGKRTSFVRPVLRDEVIAARSEAGEHILAYGRMAQSSLDALAATGIPTRVYGAREGLTEDVVESTLTFRPFSNAGFVDDLRTCRGVVAAAGFSLMSEAVFLRKPMLAIPLAGQFEQIMNARYLERLGYGDRRRPHRRGGAGAVPGPRRTSTPSALAEYTQDGNSETLEKMVDRVIDEVMSARS